MLLFTLRFRVQIPGGALAWNNAKKCASKGSSSPRCAICSIHKAKPSSGLWQWLLSHEAKVMPPSTTNVKPIRLSTSGPLHPFKPPPSMYALFWPLAWSTLLPSPPHVIGRPFPLPLGRQSPLINRIFPHWTSHKSDSSYTYSPITLYQQSSANTNVIFHMFQSFKHTKCARPEQIKHIS